MRVCAECGSASVDYSHLVGGDASCRVCSWSGRREDLVVIPVRQEGLSDDNQVFMTMYQDFRKIFRDSALPFTRFLVKWGFVDAVKRGEKLNIQKPEHVVRYINAIFQASMKSLLETRETLDKEARLGQRT